MFLTGNELKVGHDSTMVGGESGADSAPCDQARRDGKALGAAELNEVSIHQAHAGVWVGHAICREN